ncbi:hypothetical protein RHSIM_Rhsim06G0076400 [Rhododendron simsii]|uniref:Uncharacterized protein n=1 Tax=Rhododendron simsii TaxID=118357 RepID=A0A834GWG6_RHOSS|nr:hypothetical protein RHSIM_Rhsim06G0076400 [Rhododendron simsii]
MKVVAVGVAYGDDRSSKRLGFAGCRLPLFSSVNEEAEEKSKVNIGGPEDYNNPMGNTNRGEEELNQPLVDSPTLASNLEVVPDVVQAGEEEVDDDQKEKSDLKSKVWIETKKLWHIVGPTIFSRLAIFSMNLIAQAYVGHLGDLELASFTIANNIIVGFNFGLLFGDLVLQSIDIDDCKSEKCYYSCGCVGHLSKGWKRVRCGKCKSSKICNDGISGAIHHHRVMLLRSHNGVAVGSGWQAKVAFVNLGCYYVVGVPLGVVLGWVFNLGAEAEKATMRIEKWSTPNPDTES